MRGHRAPSLSRAAYDLGVTSATAETGLTDPARTEAEPPPSGRVPDAIRRRLSTLDNWLDPYSWLVTAMIVTIAAILRLHGISRPKGYIFDEVYYPTDAWDMLHRGGEGDEKPTGRACVVPPPLGKWLIALGEKAFGNHEVGWRFPAAIAGTLMILILIRVAYRLFHSVVLAGTAGLLVPRASLHPAVSRPSRRCLFPSPVVLSSF